MLRTSKAQTKPDHSVTVVVSKTLTRHRWHSNLRHAVATGIHGLGLQSAPARNWQQVEGLMLVRFEIETRAERAVDVVGIVLRANDSLQNLSTTHAVQMEELSATLLYVVTVFPKVAACGSAMRPSTQSCMNKPPQKDGLHGVIRQVDLHKGIPRTTGLR